MQSIETSSLHLDLIADLKRINSHICSIAYPILEEAGVLAKTRLKEPEPEAAVPVAAEPPAAGDGWKKRKPRTA
jgi:phosphate:Na+ symporter